MSGKKNENANLKRYIYPTIHSSATYNSQDMEAIQMLINGRMDKDDVVRYIYIYIYMHVCIHPFGRK